MDLNVLTALELAEHFGVSERAVQQWAGDGMPFTPVKGKVYRYRWADCHAWWLTHRYRGAAVPKAGGQKTPTKAESEAKLMDVKARREEMRLAKEEGRLIPVEQIEPAWLRVAETVKNRVLTLPPAVKEAIPHLTTEDMKLLDRLCREALEELSQCPASKR
jgi:phage terminase Nu1 subunit (DNA packaging protein)